MSHMSMTSRREYLQALLQERGYHQKSRKEKSHLLDEYCANTGLQRKYVIRKINTATVWTATGQRRRRVHYDHAVTAALITLYTIFDHPCGQRLVPLIKTEMAKLRTLQELICSDTVAAKLQRISFRTVDEKLKKHKEEERLKARHRTTIHPLLYQQVPVKTFAEQDRATVGLIQVDQVEHCGRSAAGEYVLTLAGTDITHGWWEGAARLGKSQRVTNAALKDIRSRFPITWAELHCDNGTPLLNDFTLQYCQETGLDFSRSRPYKKNDNCLVEQKNWTHVRKKIGYLRFDTVEELRILNDLYATEYRLYKNFFQSVMKLRDKVRVGGMIKRRYDMPQTPYHRILADPTVPLATKVQLTANYESLNPAELKRKIDAKLKTLYRSYETKKQTVSQRSERQVATAQKFKAACNRRGTFSIAQPHPVSVS